MKILSVLLLLSSFVACSGGSDESNPVAKSNSYLADLENELEDFEQVNQVIESQNTKVELIQPNNIDRDFDLQISPIINENEEPILYITSHKRVAGAAANEPFSFFKLNLYSEQVSSFTTSLNENLGRFYKILGNEFIITQLPINILQLSNGELLKKQQPWQDSIRIKNTIKMGNNICGFANAKSSPFLVFNYNINSDQISTTDSSVQLPEAGKLQNLISCFDNKVQFVLKSDSILKLYSYDFQTQEFAEILDIQDLASRVYFYHRDGGHYLAVRDSQKQWSRYSNNGSTLTTVSSIPKAQVNPFRFLRRYLSTEDSTTEDPHYYVQIEDIKQTLFETPKKIKISSGHNFNPVAKKIIKKGDRLFIISKRRNVIYEYNKAQRTFMEIGNPLAYGIYDLTFKDDDMYLVASGNRLLKYDHTAPWTYGKLEFRQLKRDAPEQNPSIIKTFSDMSFQAVNQVKNIENELYFKADLQNKAGSVLFNYDVDSDSVGDSYQSHQDLNITSFKYEGISFEVDTKLNKKRADVEEGLRAQYITLDSTLDEAASTAYINNGSQAYNRNIIDGEVFFQYGRGMYNFNQTTGKSTRIHLQNGLRSNHYILAPNKNFIYISDGKVRMLNPRTKIETDLYVLPEDKNMTRVIGLKLFNNSLFFLDQFGVVNEITLKYSDLNLQER